LGRTDRDIFNSGGFDGLWWDVAFWWVDSVSSTNDTVGWRSLTDVTLVSTGFTGWNTIIIVIVRTITKSGVVSEGVRTSVTGVVGNTIFTGIVTSFTILVIVIEIHVRVTNTYIIGHNSSLTTGKTVRSRSGASTTFRITSWTGTLVSFIITSFTGTFIITISYGFSGIGVTTSVTISLRLVYTFFTLYGTLHTGWFITVVIIFIITEVITGCLTNFNPTIFTMAIITRSSSTFTRLTGVTGSTSGTFSRTRDTVWFKRIEISGWTSTMRRVSSDTSITNGT